MIAPAITHLRLSHFRSHKRLSLDLDGRPVVLHGANGAGKTNVLEAISLLSPGRGLRRASAEDMARKPEALGWKVRATLACGPTEHDLETSSENGAARRVLIDGKTAPQTALAKLLRIVWLIPSMDRLWIESAEGRRRFLDRMTLSFFPAHAEATLAYEKAMRDRNRLMKDDVCDPHWYRALEATMARAGAAIQDNRRVVLRRISDAQEGAETAFPVALLRLLGPDNQPDPQGEDALLQTWSETRSRDIAAGRTLIGPHRADIEGTYVVKEMSARECSTGEQKALLISLILANVRALKTDTGDVPLVLLDEVAAHLDADRQAALYDEICALGTQAWMTGTGPDMFQALGNRAQMLSIGDPSEGVPPPEGGQAS